MGLLETDYSPCDNTWTGKHTPKCGHKFCVECFEALTKDGDIEKHSMYHMVGTDEVAGPYNDLWTMHLSPRNDGVMDMTYAQLEREPLFDDRDDDWDEESGTGETYWVNL